MKSKLQNSFVLETVVALVLIVLLVLLINPMNFWMPDSMHMMMVIGIALLFIVFAGFVMREQASDEREALHRFIGARFAYLAGMASLVTGVVIQSLNHTYDHWLTGTRSSS